MSLHNLPTTLTPKEHAALHNAVIRCLLNGDKDEQLQQDCELAGQWLAAQAERFYQAWEQLPEGSHLKEAYRDQVWTWSDRDLEAIPEGDTTELSWLERPTNTPERPS